MPIVLMEKLRSTVKRQTPSHKVISGKGELCTQICMTVKPIPPYFLLDAAQYSFFHLKEGGREVRCVRR